MKLFFFSVFLFLFACGSSNVESDDKSALTDSTIREAETIADEENIIIDEELPINDESEVSEEFEDVESVYVSEDEKRYSLEDQINDYIDNRLDEIKKEDFKNEQTS